MSMNISGSTPIMSGGLNLAGMDLETALLAVQNERVRLLDQQLNNQLEEVKNRNELMSKLNTLQTALDRAKQAFKADDDPDSKFKDTKIDGKKTLLNTRQLSTRSTKPLQLPAVLSGSVSTPSRSRVSSAISRA